MRTSSHSTEVSGPGQGGDAARMALHERSLDVDQIGKRFGDADQLIAPNLDDWTRLDLEDLFSRIVGCRIVEQAGLLVEAQVDDVGVEDGSRSFLQFVDHHVRATGR